MLRLQQTFGAHAGRVRELDQDVVRFGRLPTNDFAFDAHADLDASGNHAEIRREGGRYVLVDVGSRNGTLVNGRPVQRHVLAGGEEIEFGTGGPRVRVEIVASGAAVRGAPTAPATPIGSLDAHVSPHGPAAFAPATPIGAPDAHVSPHGPTAFAPAMAHPGVQAGTPAPGWSSPPGAPAGGGPPFGPPSSVPPSSPPPAPGVAPSGSPKLYGQKTLDRMIQSAIVAAQPGAASAAAPPAHDTAFIRKVADEAAGRKSRPMLFVLALAVSLFLLTLCAVSGLVAVLWARAYGL